MSMLCLALATAQAGGCVAAPTWRPAATDVDRQRLRDARTTWADALATAGKRVVGDPLFDPDRALETPLPPPGAYRCRLVNVGGAAGLVLRDWGRCAVGADSLAKLDGPQRPTGKLYRDTDTRVVFLGTLQLGDETRSVRYGRDQMRDLVGAVERVAPDRWRVALPRPSFGATLDLIELTPAQ